MGSREDHMNNIENGAIRQIAEAALHGQERLLWAGQPNPLRVAIRNLSQSFFGMLWTAFVVFMFSQVSSMNRGSSFARSSMSGFMSFFCSIGSLVPAFCLFIRQYFWIPIK